MGRNGTLATAKNGKGRRFSATAEPAWSRLSDAELLEFRICDLKLRIAGTRLEKDVNQLYLELTARGLRFRPHCWLSEDWFSPEGVPGIAIPFFLAHPRLARLERNQMLEVEGGTKHEGMRILRHEAGHAIDTAYALHRRRAWQRLFGRSSQTYPEYYQPKPYSRSYVHHLEGWYAQAHPAEDFAETFAVWLKPRSGWRIKYAGWPVIKKLRYVESTLQEIRNEKPKVRSREHVDSVPRIRKTLGAYYEEKRSRYGIGQDSYYDRDLLRLFSNAPEHAKKMAAASFLRKHRRELRQLVSHWTGQYRYTVDQIISEMIERCRELNLRVASPLERAERDAQAMLTVQTMNILHHGHHRVAL